MTYVGYTGSVVQDKSTLAPSERETQYEMYVFSVLIYTYWQFLFNIKSKNDLRVCDPII
jgi:hypothetical protein